MLASLHSTYHIGSMIGQGSSAQVFNVQHRVTGDAFACKVVRRAGMNNERTMSTETEIMMRLKHENITQLHELYETSNSQWFIMELANAGTLQTALAEEVNYTEELVAGLFKQVLSGVKHLHDMGIVHRDIKMENILCSLVVSSSFCFSFSRIAYILNYHHFLHHHFQNNSDGKKEYKTKLADFGLSAVVGLHTYQDSVKLNKEKKSYNRLRDVWGTKEYLAPEVYKKAYGPQVDVWSLGCVLYELLTGLVAFPQREHFISTIEKYMLNGGKDIRRAYQLRPQFQELSAEAQDLINHMLKLNPKQRYSIQECLRHPFIAARNARPVATHSPTDSSFRKVNALSPSSVADKYPLSLRVVQSSTGSDILVQARNAAIKAAEAKAQFLESLAHNGGKPQPRITYQ